jgi:hypothetical protein
MMRVSTRLCEEPGHEIGAEEARGIFLDEHCVRVAEIEARIHLPALAVGLERRHALLQRPDAGILEIGIVVTPSRR